MAQLTLPVILDILQTTALIVGIIYYLTIMRNQHQTQKTAIESRNAQFFMNIYFNTFDMQTSQMLWKEAHGSKYWKTFEEWWEINGPDNNLEGYTKWINAQAAFEMYGVMAKRGFIDKTVIDDMMSGTIMMYWEASEPIIKGIRSMNYPQFQEHFEYLYNEVKKIVALQHPDYQGIQS